MWGYNLKILFWNTHSNNVNEYIVNLVIDNGIDVLVMAEYEDVTDLMNCHGFAYMNCHQIDLFSVISQPHRAAA